MRQLSAGEILSLNTMLMMESNALAVAKTSLMAISDEDLRALAQSGINAAEARVTGLQQFISEHNLTRSVEAGSSIAYYATGAEGGQQ